MKNSWLDTHNRKVFAVKVRTLLANKFGRKKLQDLTTVEYKSIVANLKHLYIECGKPPLEKLTEIDEI